MNVLVIAQLYPPDMGGGGTRAQNVVTGLLMLEHKLTVVAAFPHYPTGNIPREYRHRIVSVERGENLDVIRTWVPPLASKGVLRRLVLFTTFLVTSLLALPFIGHIDVVWAANPNVLSFFAARFFGALSGSPVVQNVDDLWPEEIYDLGMMKSPFLRRVAEFACKRAYVASTALTPISQSLVDAIVTKYKREINPKKLHVVPAGVDLDNFLSAPDDFKLEEIPGAFTIVYIGAFSPAYDFGQVLKAAQLLSSRNTIKFVIQGAGELAPSIASEAKEMDLPNVSVKYKIVARDEVARTLRTASALLLPLNGTSSVEMGISSKLYEYQASGKPIICCSQGESAQYISKTGSGIVVDPGDFEGLAEAALYLHHNPGIAESMGWAGREWVKNNLSCREIGLRMEGIFRLVVEQPRPSDGPPA